MTDRANVVGVDGNDDVDDDGSGYCALRLITALSIQGDSRTEL